MRAGLRTVTGSTLPRLGWVGKPAEPFDLSRVLPATSEGAILPHKPSGGLWTAPVVSDIDFRVTGTAWTAHWDRLAGKSSAADVKITLIDADRDARVHPIYDVPDLKALEAAYRNEDHPMFRVLEGVDPEIHPFPYIDWTALAADADAIWLTRRGQFRTAHSTPALWGWDTETVLWLQPRFRVHSTVRT